MFSMDDQTKKDFEETVKERMREAEDRVDQHLETEDYMRENRKTNYRTWKTGKKWVYSAGMLTVLLGQTALDVGMGINQALVVHAATPQTTNGPTGYTVKSGSYSVNNNTSARFTDTNSKLLSAGVDYNDRDYMIVSDSQPSGGSNVDKNYRLIVYKNRSTGQIYAVGFSRSSGAKVGTAGPLTVGQNVNNVAGTNMKLTYVKDTRDTFGYNAFIVAGTADQASGTVASNQTRVPQTTYYVDKDTGQQIGPKSYTQYGSFSSVHLSETYTTGQIDIPGYTYVSVTGNTSGMFSPLQRVGQTIRQTYTTNDGTRDALYVDWTLKADGSADWVATPAAGVTLGKTFTSGGFSYNVQNYKTSGNLQAGASEPNTTGGNFVPTSSQFTIGWGYNGMVMNNPFPSATTVGTDVTYYYVANTQLANINYYLDSTSGTKLKTTNQLSGKSNTALSTSTYNTTANKLITGYVLKTDGLASAPTTFDATSFTSGTDPTPQNINLIYNKVSQYNFSVDKGSATAPASQVYKNSTTDPTKIDTSTQYASLLTGYTPYYNGTALTKNSAGTGYILPVPTDPTQPTPIVYQQDNTAINVRFVNNSTGTYFDSSVKQAVQVKGVPGTSAATDLSKIDQVIKGYVQTSSTIDNTEKYPDTGSTEEYLYYNPVGNYVVTPPGGGDPTKTPYTNNPEDPKTVDPNDAPPIPYVPGYTPNGPDGPLSPVDPNDPSKGYVPPTPKTPTGDTTITYTVDKQKLTINFVDESGTKLKDSIDKTGDSKTAVSYTGLDRYVKDYYLLTDETTLDANANFDSDSYKDQTVNLIYKKLGKIDVVPPTDDPNFPTPDDPDYPEDVNYPGDPSDPKAPWPDDNPPAVPYVPGYTPKDPSGQPLDPIDPDDPSQGYIPPTPTTPGDDVVVTYGANTQTVNVYKILDGADKAPESKISGTDAFSKSGLSKATIDYSGLDKSLQGYLLKEDGTETTTKYDSTDNEDPDVDDEEQNVYLTYTKMSQYVPKIEVPEGGDPVDPEDPVDYPNDPNDPSKPGDPSTLDPEDPDYPVIPYVPGYTPEDPSGQPLDPIDPDDPEKGYIPPAVPSDPTKETDIVYTADDQKAQVRLVDGSGTLLKNAAGKSTFDLDGKTSTNIQFSTITTADKNVPGHYLVTDATDTPAKYDDVKDNTQTFDIVYATLGEFVPSGDDPNFPGIPTPDKEDDPDGDGNINYPGDPDDPTKPWDPENPPVIPYVPGYTPEGPDGEPLDPVNPDDPTEGYKPPTPSTPGTDTPITYVSEKQTVNVDKVLDSDITKTVPGTTRFTESGKSNATIPYDGLSKLVTGYILVKDGTADVTKFDDTDNDQSDTDKTPQLVLLTYKELGSYVVTPPDGGTPTETVYPNDPDDPEKPLDPKDPEFPNDPDDPIIPYVPGYTPKDPNGNPLNPINPDDPNDGYYPPTPADPTTDTPITYTADDQRLVVKYLLDGTATELKDSDDLTGKSKAVVDYSGLNKVIDGYAVVSDQTEEKAEGHITNFDTDKTTDQEQTITYKKLGSFVPTGPEGDPDFPTTPTSQYPNDPEDPKSPGDSPYDDNGTPDDPSDDHTPLIPYVPGYVPLDPDTDQPLTPIDPNDPSKGYVPPTIDNPTTDTPIQYIKSNQKVTVDKVLASDGKTPVPGTETFTESGASLAKITYGGLTKAVPGYILVDDGTTGVTEFDNTDNKGGNTDLEEQHVLLTYNKLNQYVPSFEEPEDPDAPVIPLDPDAPKVPDPITYPNDPDDPTKPMDPSDPDYPVIPYVPGYEPHDPSGDPLKPVDPEDPSKGYIPPVPKDPTVETPITYVADDQHLIVDWVDKDGNSLTSTTGISTMPLDGKSYEEVQYSSKFTDKDKIVDGHYLISDGTKDDANKYYDADKSTDQRVKIVYGTLGKYVPEGPTDDPNFPDIPETTYPNDPSDPSKPYDPTDPDNPNVNDGDTPNDPSDDTPIVPYVPGYTPMDDGGTPDDPSDDTPLDPIDPDVPSKGYIPPTPTDPSKDTTIKYVVAQQTVNVDFVLDEDHDTKLQTRFTENGDSGTKIPYKDINKVIYGYYMVSDGTTSVTTFDKTDNEPGEDDATPQNVLVTYDKLGQYVPKIETPTDDPNQPDAPDTVTYPNDPTDPSKPGGSTTYDPNDTPDDPSDDVPIIPHVPGYTPSTDPNNTPDNPDDDVPLTPVDPEDPSKGYIPPTPTDPGKDTDIIYKAIIQGMVVSLVDQDNNPLKNVKDVDHYDLTGESNTKIDYSGVNRSVSGYYLVSDETTQADKAYFDNSDVVNDQTAKIVYNKLGQFTPESDDPNFPGIPTPSKEDDPDGDGDINYPGDPSDPKAPYDPEDPPVIPYVPGYTPTTDPKNTPDDPSDDVPLTPVDPEDPSKGYNPPEVTDPGKDTPINYAVAKQHLNVDFVLDDDHNTKVQTSYAEDGTSGSTIKYTGVNKVVSGYYMVSDGTEGVTKFDTTDNEPDEDDKEPQNLLVTYDELGKYVPKIETPTDDPNQPDAPSDVQYPNDPSDPKKPGGSTTYDPNDTPDDPSDDVPIIPHVPGYTPSTDPNNTPDNPDDDVPLTPVDPDDPSKGYVPPTPTDPGKDTDIIYKAIIQGMVVSLVDQSGQPVSNTDKLSEYSLTGNSNTKINYSGVNRSVSGYYLVSDETTEAANAYFDNSDVVNDQTAKIVYNKLASFVPQSPDDPNFPETPAVPYPGDPSDPKAPYDPEDPPVIPFVPGYTPSTDPNNTPDDPSDDVPLTPIDPEDPSKGYEPPKVTDPGTDTPIIYTADAQKLTVNLVLASDGKTPVTNTESKSTYALSGKTATAVNYSSVVKSVDNYVLTKDGTSDAPNYDRDSTVDQTVTLEYKPMGKFTPSIKEDPNVPAEDVPELPGGDIVYPNDPKDPTDNLDPHDPDTDYPSDKIIPPLEGYTPQTEDGTPLEPVDPKDPSKGYYPPVVDDPTVDTPIIYVVDGQNLNVVFKTEDVKTSLKNTDGKESVPFSGPSATNVNYASLNKVVTGYYMVTDGTLDSANAKYDSDESVDQTVTITYAKMGSYVPKFDETPPDPNAPELPDPITYPNDPDDPEQPLTPEAPGYPVIPYVPGYTPHDPDGNPLDPVDPDDPSKGYEPPAPDPDDPGKDTDIVYLADDQKMLVKFFDRADTSDTPADLKPVITLKGASDKNIYYTDDSTATGTPIDKYVPGYVLVSDETTKTDSEFTYYDNDAHVNQEAILLYDKLGSVNFVVDKTDDGDDDTPDVPDSFVYPNDPDDPSKTLDPHDPDYPLTEDGTPIVPYYPGYTPTTDPNNTPDDPSDDEPLTPIDPGDPTKGYYPPGTPDDPTQNTTVTYHQDEAKLTVNLVDESGKALTNVTDGVDHYDLVGKANDKVKYDIDRVVKGYYLYTDDTTKADFEFYDTTADSTDVSQVANIVYKPLGDYTFTVTPPDGADDGYNPPAAPGDIQFTNDPNDPGQPMNPSDPDDPKSPNPDYPTDNNVPYIPGYTPNGPDGPLEPVAPDDPSKGYIPPTPNPKEPGVDIEINYTANDQIVEVTFWAGQTQLTNDSGVKTDEFTGKTGQTIDYTGLDRNVKGYILKIDGTTTTTVYDDQLDTEAASQQVRLEYVKLAQFVPDIVVPDGATDTPNDPSPIDYPNDPSNPGSPMDPENPDYPVIPYVPGYTPQDDNGTPDDPSDDTPLTPIDPNDPSKGYVPPTIDDPTVDTPIKYAADDQKAKVRFVDESGKELKDAVALTPGKTSTPMPLSEITAAQKVVTGYYMVTDGTQTPTNYDNDTKTDQVIDIVYKAMASYVPEGPTGDPDFPEIPATPYPNDPSDPEKPADPNVPETPKTYDPGTPDDPSDDTPIVPYVPDYTPKDPGTGEPLDPVDPDDPSKGYIPPKVTDPGTDTPIKYVKVLQELNVKFVLNDAASTELKDAFSEMGKSNATITWKGLDRAIPGYILLTDETVGVETFDATDNSQALKDEAPQNYVITYGKLANFVPEIVTPDGHTDTPDTPTPIEYPNNPDDPAKPMDPNDPDYPVIPFVPGYTPQGPDGPLDPVDPNDPSKGYVPPTIDDPTVDTPIKYAADDQKAKVRFVDESGKELKTAVALTPGKTSTPMPLSEVTVAQKVVPGYYMVKDGTQTPTNYDNDSKTDQVIDIVYKKMASYVPEGPKGDPDFPEIPATPYPNDPSNPENPADPNVPETPKTYDPGTPDDPSDDTPIVPYVPDYTPKDPGTGEPLKPVDPNDPSKGYIPPKVTDPGKDTPIQYVKVLQEVNVKFVLDSNHAKQLKDAFTEAGKSNAKITWKGMNKVVKGYVMVSDGTVGVKTFDATDNSQALKDEAPQNYVITYAKMGAYVPDGPSGFPGVPDISYPNDPDDPGKPLDPSEPNHPLVPYVPGYVPNGPDGTPLKPVDPEDPTKGYVPPGVDDPTTDTPIHYVESVQHLTVRFYDDKGNVLTNVDGKKSYALSGLADSKVDYSDVAKVVKGYYLVTDGTTGTLTYDHDSDVDQEVKLIYKKLGGLTPQSPDPDFPGVPPIEWPGDPDDPTAPFDPETPPIVPYVPGYTPHDPDGNPLTPVDPEDPEKGYHVPNIDDPGSWTDIEYTPDPAPVPVPGDITGNTGSFDGPVPPAEVKDETPKAVKTPKAPVAPTESTDPVAPASPEQAPLPDADLTTNVLTADTLPIIPNQAGPAENRYLPETGDEDSLLGLTGVAMIGLAAIAALKKRKKNGRKVSLATGSSSAVYWKNTKR